MAATVATSAAIQGYDHDHDPIGRWEPGRVPPGVGHTASRLPEQSGAAVRAVRRDLHLHEKGRGHLQAEQVALLRPGQDAERRPPQGLDEAGGLPERHRPRPDRGDREAGGRRAHHLDAVLHPEQGAEGRVRLHRHPGLQGEGRLRAGREDDRVLAERLDRVGGGDQGDAPGDQGRQRRRRPRPQAERPGEVFPDQGADHDDPGGEGGQVRPGAPAEAARWQADQRVCSPDLPGQGRELLVRHQRRRRLPVRRESLHLLHGEGRARRKCDPGHPAGRPRHPLVRYERGRQPIRGEGLHEPDGQGRPEGQRRLEHDKGQQGRVLVRDHRGSEPLRREEGHRRAVPQGRAERRLGRGPGHRGGQGREPVVRDLRRGLGARRARLPQVHHPGRPGRERGQRDHPK
jgi:hypothetical protein